MGEVDEYAVGKIFGLFEFINKEGIREALTYDLMVIGKSIHDLGTPRLSWEEVGAFIQHAPHESMVRQQTDDMAVWKSPRMQLILLVGDMLAGANWQRGGGKSSKPVPLFKQLERNLRLARMDSHGPKSLDDISQTRERLRKRRERLARPQG